MLAPHLCCSVRAGVGGGISQNGDVPATTGDEAGALPFFGIFGVYDRATDPWRTHEPESVRVEVRDWRRRFYRDTSRWLMRNGGEPACVGGGRRTSARGQGLGLLCLHAGGICGRCMTPLPKHAGVAHAGPDYRVDGLYLWNLASW